MALHAAWRFARGPRGTVVLLALVCALLPCPVSAQNPALDVKYTRQTRFWIPFEPEGAVQRLRQVELHVSRDQGRTWGFFERAAPAQRGFQFFAERDGIYWFTVRTVDIDNRAFPPTLEGSQPQLVVCVDTLPPSVRLFPLSPQEGVGVGWEVRDDNLDLSTLRLEWRGPGGNWQPLQTELAANGRWTLQAGGGGIDELRLQVRDRAGNQGEGLTSLSGRRNDSRTYPPEPGAANSGRPMTRLVNSTQIKINYRVEDVGPSKATLELWWTRNGGRTWEKYPEPMPEKPPCVVNAPQEGVYGFTLVARSGVNLGDRPPQPNDLPQISVEVDLREPLVQLTSVEVGRGQDANRMTIRWSARDQNLEERPVKLEYAPVTVEAGVERVGAWQEIAANLASTGEHFWLVPNDGVLYHVRALARDRAGNVGQAKTNKPVVVDLSRPRGVIIDVEPVRGQPTTSGVQPDSGNSITLPRQ